MADRDATRAFDAIRKLGVSPDQSVTLLRERIHPASSPDPKLLAQLLADLENGGVELRWQAESELEKSWAIWPSLRLRKALEGDPPLILRKPRRATAGQAPRADCQEQMRDAARLVELLELYG